ncbi:hypothetical protein BRYFOR_07210 [Marvinbryantia formatexigens DSM 14469]|uniref:Uncharacterized protein n=1 Tax=Marvinbryantia formatexigens DSM 14469 TaxID=478749 RepID=C6LF09_9FIRM|nr:hypothetical protein BRYFOR_07210 [Marvinbryantia formatexigens DSM 14469]
MRGRHSGLREQKISLLYYITNRKIMQTEKGDFRPPFVKFKK